MKACRLCWSALAVGLFACGARVPVGDLGDASTDGPFAGSGGVAGQGGSAGTGVTTSGGSGGVGGDGGSGGVTTGSGGVTTGSGGVTTGSGGVTTGSGGVTTGSGGATAGTGGATAGSGGTTTIDSGVFSDATACVAEVFQAEKRPVDLYMMIDSSGSMDMIDAGQTLSRWNNLAQAMPTFVNDPANAGIEVGLDFFPEGGVQTSCVVADYTSPNVPVDSLPGMNNIQANAIVTAIQGRTRVGTTPTVSALTGALDVAKAWQLAHAARNLSLLFLTDGQPTGCQDNTTTAAATVAQTYLAIAPHIKTYVLGVGPDTGNLDPIAAAGGTTMAYSVTSGAAGELAQALTAIRKNMQAGCSYNIPQPNSGKADPLMVNVKVKIGTGGATQILNNVGNSTICSNMVINPTGEGWYYDDPPPDAPTQIILCPNSCGPLLVTDGSEASILLGCPTRALPPPQ